MRLIDSQVDEFGLAGLLVPRGLFSDDEVAACNARLPRLRDERRLESDSTPVELLPRPCPVAATHL